MLSSVSVQVRSRVTKLKCLTHRKAMGQHLFLLVTRDWLVLKVGLGSSLAFEICFSLRMFYKILLCCTTWHLRWPKYFFCKTSTSWYQGVVPSAPNFSHKRIGILLCDTYNISKKKLAFSGLSCFHFLSKSENVFKFRLCHHSTYTYHHFFHLFTFFTLPSLCLQSDGKVIACKVMAKWKK